MLSAWLQQAYRSTAIVVTRCLMRSEKPFSYMQSFCNLIWAMAHTSHHSDDTVAIRDPRRSTPVAMSGLLSSQQDDALPPAPSVPQAEGRTGVLKPIPALKPEITSTRGSRTSRSAYDLPPPDPDDPLLGFEPVPHKQVRRNSINPERQRAFIAELAACGIVTEAARRIGASLEALYRLRTRPGAGDFSAAWDLAVDRGVMRLEDGALARAIEGEERMVVSAGQLIGTERRHNDALVMFFLRGRRGARYSGGTGGSELKPGHPVYERIRQEVLDAEYVDEDEILNALDAKIDAMREREEEAARLLAAPCLNTSDEDA